jgi:hypothetical protein|tara:strand:+ start:174 stop:389 length:216 start_codon:yes stop_codon:yes gene_type:complete
MKNKFHKALENEVDASNDFISINKAIQQARDINIIDLVDMSGRTMGEVAEILALLKNCSQLEIIEFEGYEA